jgi:acetyl-CoA synthetase
MTLLVGATGETTGEAIVVAKEIDAIANPKRILVVPELPKTRSGKMMRRLLRAVTESCEIGDVATLSDTSAMRVIADSMGWPGS